MSHLVVVGTFQRFKKNIRQFVSHSLYAGQQLNSRLTLLTNNMGVSGGGEGVETANGKYQMGVKTYQGLGWGWRIQILLSVKTCGQDSCWGQSGCVLINRILTSIWSELGPILVRPEIINARLKYFSSSIWLTPDTVTLWAA